MKINKIKFSTRFIYSVRAVQPSYSCRYILLALAALLIQAGSTFAQDRGGYTGSFLRYGLGARAKAMGGAFVGITGDIYNSYYNPAGLPDLESREATFSYRNLSLDRVFLFAGFASALPPFAGFAIGVLHSGVNNIDGRDFSGNHTQFYENSQNAVLFAFGLKITQWFAVGAGGTLYRESFPQLEGISAQGFGINTGILLKPLANLKIGASIRDIRAKFSWNSEDLYDRGSSITDDFPVVYTAGAGYHVEQYYTTFLLDVYKNSKSDPGYRIGFENQYLNQVMIRGGLNNGDLTAGFGFLFNLLNSAGSFNYAFEISDIDPETTQILTFTVAF